MARKALNAIGNKEREARERLKRLGHTYRSAAAALGISYGHLAMVLNGHRESRRLLAAIEALPNRKEAGR